LSWCRYPTTKLKQPVKLICDALSPWQPSFETSNRMITHGSCEPTRVVASLITTIVVLYRQPRGACHCDHSYSYTKRPDSILQLAVDQFTDQSSLYRNQFISMVMRQLSSSSGRLAGVRHTAQRLAPAVAAQPCTTCVTPFRQHIRPIRVVQAVPQV
jgi:hypothetical protein